jgi:anti-repressor protein
MSALAIQAPTMSSREIADLAGARHNDVVATITRLFDKGLLRSSRERRIEQTGGRPTAVFDLVERDVHLVISGYSDEVRARIIDRWHELEARALSPALPDFTDPAAAARAWASEFEKKRVAEALAAERSAQLALAAPKVDFAEAVLNSDGTLLVRDVAKTLGVPVRKLEKALREKRVVLPNNAPAAEYVSKGYFKETFHPHVNSKGNEVLKPVARVTGLGVEFLRRFSRRHLQTGSLA